MQAKVLQNKNTFNLVFNCKKNGDMVIICNPKIVQHNHTSQLLPKLT